MVKNKVLYGFVAGTITVLLIGQVASMAFGGSGLSDDEMRDALAQHARRGEGHSSLKPLKATNEQQIKWYPSAGAEARESKSRSEAEWILDDLFLTQKIRGDWLGLSFEGHAILGYDSATEEYQLAWMTNRLTQVVVLRGKGDPSGEGIILHGEFLDPITKQTRKTRIVFRITDNKGAAHIDVFDTTSGDEYRMFEVDSTRWIARGA